KRIRLLAEAKATFIATDWDEENCLATVERSDPHEDNMEQTDKDLWTNFICALGKKGRITGVTQGEAGIRSFDFSDENGNWNMSVRPRIAYILGIDVAGYSRRSFDGQLLLTTWLFAIIQKSITDLRGVKWMPENQPSALIPTGDGAL